MNAIQTFLSGKKTYIVAIAMAALSGWQALGHPVPESVWALLGAMGMGALRAGMSKQRR